MNTNTVAINDFVFTVVGEPRAWIWWTLSGLVAAAAIVFVVYVIIHMRQSS